MFGRNQTRVAAPVAAAPRRLTGGEPDVDDGAAAAGAATDDAGAPAIEERPIPNIVSAAWELELLIAGAVTFALFQLPGAIERLNDWLALRVSGAGEFAMYMGILYLKAIVYSLIAAFVTNLAARAYWVGLVGLHSVYPRGVQWDKLGMGPVSQEVYRARLSSLPAVMARVDNFASVIFSFAFLIVASFIFSVVLLGVVGGIGYLVSASQFGGKYLRNMAYGTMLAALVTMMTIGLIDKYGARRLDPAGRGYRWLRGAVRATSRVTGMAVLGPILFTLMSNVGRHRMMLMFYVAIFGSLGVTLVEFLSGAGAIRSGTPRYVPQSADVRGVDAEHYESMRASNVRAMVPTIQSDVISGPFVRLFIPYDVERHDEALASSCTGLAPMRSGRPHLAPTQAPIPNDPAAADRALGCLRAMHALALDGVPRPEVPLRFHVHPTSGRDGLLAYIPTAALASGMHTLRVMPPPRSAKSKRRGQPLVPYEIVFWK